MTTLNEADRLKLRIAWAYYVENMTQSEIATRFGINRIRVTRTLAACREEGIVQIRINAPGSEFAALEADLERRWDLRRVIVAPRPANGSDTRLIIAAAAGSYISDQVAENQSIGIGWGRTLRLSLNYIGKRTVPGLSVVALMGGLTAASRMNTYESASHLADILDAVCYYIAAPAFTKDEASKNVLLSQDIILEVLDLAKGVDCAIVSVGSFDEDSTLVSLGLVTQSEVESLREAGSVGDLLGHFLDVDGEVINHPLNKRVVALHPSQLREVKSVILACGGPQKLPAMRAALRGRYVNTLITDEDTARALLP
ncbi:DNA-binding transcriptional regulator LsrR (DeoR family) [Phyllobacterium trifolii]|uniref:DNA-binding transcriptional regulator LsrR (DeoR family) n=1 Tax=Phyllobacterium trifolii TaxID=300193 RepID=A0A839UI76_9HYPH|nr:sugar-binding transcriptional regulator [Phyllobacterium trifolii]MBB3149615.1 DNA-binding transcriptional regulator LsrR (DeoR family) [Phyllobacterium trifolii]